MKRLVLIVGILVCTAAVFFWYLSNRIQTPEFVKIVNARLSEIDEQNIAQCQAEVVLFNPNTLEAKLVYTDIAVYSNDLKVANISQTSVSEIPAKKEFVLPLSCKINLVNAIGSQGLSGILEKALSSEKKLPLTFQGYCRVVVKGHAYRIPINIKETIALK